MSYDEIAAAWTGVVLTLGGAAALAAAFCLVAGRRECERCGRGAIPPVSTRTRVERVSIDEPARVELHDLEQLWRLPARDPRR